MAGRIAALLLAVVASVSHAEDRIINADVTQTKGGRALVWQDTVGAGRVAEGLRDTWRRQLDESRAELGFKYLRMHGLLEDELGVYSEDSSGTPRYNWQYIDDVYDYLLSIGMKPFVEIGFMPKALASGSATVFWWNANVTPPRDYAKWDALVTALVQHWTARYGEQEIASWRFEIWNEPNLGMFWRPEAAGDARDAYFELYRHTARAVTRVSPRYKVGGPGGAGPAWTAEFIEMCEANRVPVDFISYHAYGLGGGPSGLDLFGNAKLYLNPALGYVADTVNSQWKIIEASPKPSLPVHITEWSTSYSPRDPIHDSYFSAPFILEQLRNTERASSMSYWTFTDVFEENGPVPRPFHGGFGLINFQGIRKPAFWAYRYLAMLGETEVVNQDAHSYVTRDIEGGTQVLLWDLSNPINQGQSNQDHFFKPHPAKIKGEVKIRVAGIKRGNYRVDIYRIGYRHNDPYSRYLEMGQPTDLSREAVAKLKALSSGAPVSERTLKLEGAYETSMPLLENDVYLITLTPVSKLSRKH